MDEPAPVPPGPLSATADLLRRARAGDAGALDDLFRRHLPPLRRWARGRLPRWTRDLRDTEDVVQETLLQTLKRIDVFEPRHEGALQAYLRQALINRVRDEVRRLRPLSGSGGPGGGRSVCGSGGIAAGGSHRVGSARPLRSGHAAIETGGAGNHHRARRDAAELSADRGGARKVEPGCSANGCDPGTCKTGRGDGR